MRTRKGFSLAEVLVAMVILAIVGSSLIRLLMGQARFYERQNASRSARVVSRAALNVLLSELRMVETAAGVVAASSTSLTLRVPYAMGLVCGTSGGATTVSLLPVDSVMYAEAGFSGHAWRNGSGVYSYTEAGAGLAAGSAATCTAAGITTLTGGSLVGVTPALPAGATAGSAVFLYRKVTYDFAASTSMPGRTALWRRMVSTGTNEELVVPFDAAAKFRFFALNANAAQDAVPTLANIRGIELVLTGASERIPRGASAYQLSSSTTAVFFKNKL